MHTKESGSIFVPHGVVSWASVILLFNWPFQITPRRSTNTLWRVFTAEFVMTRSVACITTSCCKKTERYSFIGVCSKTTSVNWQQKGSPFSILIKQEMMGLQWRHVGSYAKYLHITTDDHTNTSLTIFAGQMLLLIVNQQCQSSY